MLLDIEELNRRAHAGEFDLTKLSVGAFASVGDRYRLLRSGAALGHGVGPLVVARTPMTLAEAVSRQGGHPRDGDDGLSAAAPGGRLPPSAGFGVPGGEPALPASTSFRRGPRGSRSRPDRSWRCATTGSCGPSRRRSGCRADHPRESLHVRRSRTGEGDRSRRLVGEGDRAFPFRSPGSAPAPTWTTTCGWRPSGPSAHRCSTRSIIRTRAASTSALTRRRCPTRSARSTSRCTSTSTVSTSATRGIARDRPAGRGKVGPALRLRAEPVGEGEPGLRTEIGPAGDH